MTLTVGELVAYAQVDRTDFTRGTKAIASDLKALQGTTTTSMAGMEGSVVRSLADIQRAIADGLDPADAIRDLDRLEASLDQSLKSMEADADRFAAELERAMDEAFDEVDQARHGRIDVDVDADITEALAALHALEAAAEDAGNRAGDGFVRGADGKLRDARGRFVAEGSTLFDGLAEGAERTGSLVGKALEGGLGVIGKAGPANVAIFSAAIAALPTVASIAASAIGAALGGGLLAVGLTAAASADRVKHAWSETVSEIKAELATAAQPLEGSAIRAADVTKRTFEQLKPSLARIWKDLVPDVDRFVERVGQGVGSLGPTLERLGDSFGNVLSELGDRMPAIIDNIAGTIDTFTAMMDDDPQMLANLAEDATELLQAGAELLSWADELKVAFSAPFGPAGSQAGSDYFMKQMFGGTTEEIAAGMAELPILLAKMQTEAAAGALAVSNVGGAGKEAADGVRNFSDALKELFDPAAAALDAEIRLKAALQDAAKAAKDKTTTDVDRMRSVQDLTRAIADAATAEHDQTGKTTAASKAFAEQLPTLADLAGKNKTAQDAVAGLGNSLGVTIKRTDDGKIAFDKFGKAIITLPNGKTVKVDADTAKALSDLAATKKKTDDLKDKKVEVKAEVAKAVAEVKKVVAGLDGLKGEANKAGQGIGSGLIAGIHSMIGQAAAAAQTLAKSALQAAKNALGIHSPSTEMAEVGKWTVRGLIQGLQSEEANAVSTVEQMVGKIKEAFKSQPDVADHLVAFVTKGNDSLAALAKQREDLVKRLAEAKEYAKTVAGDAKEWAAITGLSEEELKNGDFSGALKSRAQAIKDFANDIQTLAKRGLNKTTLKQIIDAGVEGGASIAEMLVGADGSEIKAINKAQKQIDNMSKKLGKSGADALYDVGKKAGDGYLKGLQDSLAKLDATMKKIVDALVKAIKKELKIKSPSQVMADIGVQTMAGLAAGMNAMSDVVRDTATSLVNAAMTSATQAAASGMGSLGMFAGSIGKTPAMAGLGMQGVPYKTPPVQAPAGGTPDAGGVTVNIENATVRTETDIAKVGQEFAFVYRARA